MRGCLRLSFQSAVSGQRALRKGDHKEERSGRLEVQCEEQKAVANAQGRTVTSAELCCFTATGGSAQSSC